MQKNGMEFETWFETNFGKRPLKRSLYEMEEEIKFYGVILKRLIRDHESVDTWEKQRYAALLAWDVSRMSE